MLLRELTLFLLMLLPMSADAQQVICTGESTAELRRVPIHLVDATDGETPETGLTLSGADVQVSVNGASYANGTGSVTEIGSGDYYYEFHADEVASSGALLLKVEESGTSKVFTGHYQVKPCVTVAQVSAAVVAESDFTDMASNVESILEEAASGSAGGGVVADAEALIFDAAITGSHTNTTSTAVLLPQRFQATAIHAVIDHLSGTTPTLDITLEHSHDGSNFVALGTALTQVTTSDSFQVQTISEPVMRFVRIKYSTGGTNPNYQDVDIRILGTVQVMR